MGFESIQLNIEELKHKLFRFAFRLMKDESEAKDIVQETFIKIHEMGNSAKTINNIEAWSIRVAKNLAMDQLKSYRYRNTEGLNGTSFVSGTENPHNSLVSKDIRNSIDDIVSNLPLAQKEVFHLRDIEGNSYEEIAETLQISLNQVKVNLFRARQKIRKEFIKKEEYGL